MPELTLPYPSASQVAEWIHQWFREFVGTVVCPAESSFYRTCLQVVFFAFIFWDISHVVRLVAVTILKRYTLGDKQLPPNATTNLYGFCWPTDLDWTTRSMSVSKLNRQAEGLNAKSQDGSISFALVSPTPSPSTEPRYI